MKYVKSHIVGFIHPRINHDLIPQNYVFESIEVELLMDFVEVSIEFLIV